MPRAPGSRRCGRGRPGQHRAALPGASGGARAARRRAAPACRAWPRPAPTVSAASAPHRAAHVAPNSARAVGARRRRLRRRHRIGHRRLHARRAGRCCARDVLARRSKRPPASRAWPDAQSPRASGTLALALRAEREAAADGSARCCTRAGLLGGALPGLAVYSRSVRPGAAARSRTGACRPAPRGGARAVRGAARIRRAGVRLIWVERRPTSPNGMACATACCALRPVDDRRPAYAIQRMSKISVQHDSSHGPGAGAWAWVRWRPAAAAANRWSRSAPTRMLVFGDEMSVTRAARPQVQRQRARRNGDIECTLDPLWMQHLARHVRLAFEECNPVGVAFPRRRSTPSLAPSRRRRGPARRARAAAGRAFATPTWRPCWAGGNDVLDLYRQYLPNPTAATAASRRPLQARWPRWSPSALTGPRS